jgi:hypothetical protein
MNDTTAASHFDNGIVRGKVSSFIGTIIGLLRFSRGSAGRAMRTISIRVVLFEDAAWWCAQCLEHDIAAQARTLPELREELERVLTAHALLDLESGNEPFAKLPCAPQRFFDMYETASSPIEISDRHVVHSRRFDVVPYLQSLTLQEMHG